MPSHHKTRISNPTSLSSLDGVVEKRLEKSFILQTPKMAATTWPPTEWPLTTRWSPTESIPTTRLSPTSMSWTTQSSRPTPLTWISAELSRTTLTMWPSTLTTMKAETTLTPLSRLGSILTSTWQGFLDNFEVMDGMTEGVQREFRDHISQISKPRVEEAESSRSRRESTSWEQPGSRTSTSTTSNTTSTATSTVSLTTVSEKMPSPTPAVQPHWKATTKLTSKGKELENKSVKNQRPDSKENDMRDHLSGYDDEDEDQSSLKLGIGRPDEEEDQGPNMEDEQDDAHNPASRRNNNQVAGVEAQNPAEEKPHSQANGDEHDDCHNQVYGRHSQVLGVEPQVSTFRRPNNQVTGVEPQVSTSRRPNNQVTGVGAQVSTPRRPNKQVTGREVQSSDSEEFMAQPPCCLPHSCKTNIIFTERLLLRNSSKDTDKSDKNFRKEVKVLEFMNWLKAVFELSALTTAFHLSMGPGFHNNSTKSLESPQTSLGHAVQQQTEKEGKKNLCEEPGGTGRVTYFYSLLVLLVLILLIGTTSNKVHQFTSTDGLGVITVKPMAAYRGFGEDL